MSETPDWLEIAADILPWVLLVLAILLLLGGLEINIHFESHP